MRIIPLEFRPNKDVFRCTEKKKARAEMVVKLKENFSANLCQEEDPHFEGMGVIVANDDELQLDQMS